MTLIAMRPMRDRVEFLEDSLSYGPQGVVLAFDSTKVRLLPAIDAAFAAYGPSELGQAWERLTADPAVIAAGFDVLHQVTAAYLRRVWDTIPNRTSGRGTGGVIQAGWSAQMGRFVGYQYDWIDDFRPVEVPTGKLVAQPHVAELEQDGTDSAWGRFARTTYERCTLIPYTAPNKVLIGGTVRLTQVTRGGQSQRPVMELPRVGWEFRKSMIGLLHPIGQLGPCVCGSGKPFVLCHVQRMPPDHLCDCGEIGELFWDCHYVDPAGPVAAAHWRQYGRDLTRWNDELRESFQAFHRRARANTWLRDRAAVLTDHGSLPIRQGVVA